MKYFGDRCGFVFSRYDPAMDENTWTLIVCFGGRLPPPPPGKYGHPYRFAVRAEWRPLATCFEWWCEFLYVETQWRHMGYVHERVRRGVVIQYRIHSLRRWPVAVRFVSAPNE